MKIVQVCTGCGVATRLYENDPGCFACTDCLTEGEEFAYQGEGF